MGLTPCDTVWCKITTVPHATICIFCLLDWAYVPYLSLAVCSIWWQRGIIHLSGFVYLVCLVCLFWVQCACFIWWQWGLLHMSGFVYLVCLVCLFWVDIPSGGCEACSICLGLSGDNKISHSSIIRWGGVAGGKSNIRLLHLWGRQ